MKKCVANSSTRCYYPIAECRGGDKNCKNKDYPSKWGFPTCTSELPKVDDSTESDSESDVKVPSNMRMAGETELKAFEMQNKIRKSPKSLVSEVEDQISRFDKSGMFLTQKNGGRLRANEGVKAWKEAADVLRK